MSCSSACSSNFFTSSGSMRKRRLRSSSCVFSARHTSTTTLMPPLWIPTSAPTPSSGYASLACCPLDHLVGVFGSRRPVLLGDGRVVDGGNDGALHVLHAFEAVEGRVGFEGDGLYSRVVLLETRRRTDEGAARAKPCNEVCDLAFRLLPDLRRRRLVVRARIGRIGVLVRIEVTFGILGVEPPCLTDGPVRALVRVGQHEVDAVGAQDLLSLLAGILRHTKFHLVAERGADPGVRDPRVSARRVEDSLLRRQRARLLTVPDHP